MNGLLVALLLSQAYYAPEEAEAIFAEANQAYTHGDFTGARERYERLFAHGYGGADVLYNAGTAALAEGKLGEAVLYLERAVRAGDSESDLEANLTLARSRQLDQVAGEFAEEPLANRIAQAFPPAPTAWLFAGSWAAAFVALTLARFRGMGARTRLVGWLVLGLVSLPAGVLTGIQIYASGSLKQAVVMPASLKVYELPRADARVAFEVHAGLKIRLLKEAGDYVRIQLPNGLEAWAQRQALSGI